MVVTGNPGCLLQIGKHLNAADEPADPRGNGALDEMTPDTRTLDGTGLPLLHPVQLLDASIRGVSVPRS
jgi:glycolate oxidase iron-sulfur subunit